MTYYREKTNIGGETCYDNSWGAVLLFRCRSNTLKLGWRERFLGGRLQCAMCDGGEEETLEHFLVECEGLRDVRRRWGISTVAEVMDFGGDGNRSKAFLEDAWECRRVGMSV